MIIDWENATYGIGDTLDEEEEGEEDNGEDEADSTIFVKTN